MKHCEVSQIFFSETYVVPAEYTAQTLFRLLPHGKAYADRMVKAMATGYLVAVLRSAGPITLSHICGGAQLRNPCASKRWVWSFISFERLRR